MKKIIAFILIIFIHTSGVALAKGTDEFLSVADGAQMLSEATERYIYTQNRALSKKTEARIIFATVESTGDLDTYACAAEMYDSLGVSHIGRNNSIFVLLCKEEKDYAIIVSDGINAALTDSKAQRYLAGYLEPDFDKGSVMMDMCNQYGIDKWACLLVCFIEGCSIIGNILKPKGIDFNLLNAFREVGKATFKKAQMEVDTDRIFEKEKPKRKPAPRRKKKEEE